MVSFFQFSLYWLKDYYGFIISNRIILLLILIGYYFIFPSFFVPELNIEKKFYCGPPPLISTTFFFVCFGTLSATIIHLTYSSFSKKKNN
ncbi:hypothetical protein UJ101_00776 [Flavobacteriaceae bacterium UJ101]|nr:hypothetical protein UJ101_00776 [Flavobacteriaceae bacterium UJ101]